MNKNFTWVDPTLRIQLKSKTKLNYENLQYADVASFYVCFLVKEFNNKHVGNEYLKNVVFQ